MFTVRLISYDSALEYKNCKFVSYNGELDLLTFKDESGKEHRTNSLFEVIEQ